MSVQAQALIDFAIAACAHAGVAERDALLLADSLVQADLWGHQSHGVLERLPTQPASRIAELLPHRWSNQQPGGFTNSTAPGSALP